MSMLFSCLVVAKVCTATRFASYNIFQWTRGLPIEVVPFAYKPVKIKLEKMGGTAELRMAEHKAVCVMVGYLHKIELFILGPCRHR